MPNKIDEQLQRLHEQKRKGLMTHVVVGYPSLQTTVDLVLAMEKSGVDFVELQIPFSDPLADGSTIQLACEEALANGTRVRDAFTVARQLTSTLQIPLLFMAYCNTVYKYGIDRFCKDAAKAGISGLIVPDLPLEAAQHEHFLASCKQHGLYNIITLAPTSTDERIHANADIAAGFVYCMSRQGVTGTQTAPTAALGQYLERVRKHIAMPLAVGFGIANSKQLTAVLQHADIAIVGSAIIDKITGTEPKKIIPTVSSFLQELTAVTRKK